MAQRFLLALMLAWVVAVAPASLALATTGPGPSEPFGDDDAGCVPTTAARLDCALATARAFDKLERAIGKCHADQADARFLEVSLNVSRPFDEEACEDSAAARLDATMTRLLAGTCVSSPSAALYPEHLASLRTALDSATAGPWCDDSSGARLDESGDDPGYVPATAGGAKCAHKVAKNLDALAKKLRRCHRTAADKAFDLADPAFDEEACENAARAKFDAATNGLALRNSCPACLATSMQAMLADDLTTRIDSTNGEIFPCPDPVLHIYDVRLDRPTLVTLGVQLLIVGDDDHDASVAVRYRATGESTWHDAPPLYRVRPEDTHGRSVPEQFAGSIFDLRPSTTWEIELHAVDSDGPVDETIPLVATTRAIPADPASPRGVSVSDTAGLVAALAAARAGDIIEIADGTYIGPFVLDASGTSVDPIVVRGASRDGTILDGANCDACNVLEVYGSFVHVERLTLRHANRALRFQTMGSEGNVARRLHTIDTRLGIAGNARQLDFTICDNLMEGRLAWPHIYTDDGGIFANDDGINVQGSGHVVCHNDIVGFGDAMKTEEEGARAIDFYGNEIRSAYDNGLELDYGEGNVRALRNRFTNNFMPLSFQPIHGGPAYAIRNVAVNVVDEQLKFHGIGQGSGPTGVLVWHNTFVSAEFALAVHTDAASHWSELANNVFVGPPSPATRVVDWTAPLDHVVFDYDGYWPDGGYRFNVAGGGLLSFTTFADLQVGGIETNGRLLTQPVFANGLVGSPDFTPELTPQDVTLDASGNAIDAGRVLVGIDDGYLGTAPDLGALERGCPLPIYGIRPVGIDDSNEPFGCPAP